MLDRYLEIMGSRLGRELKAGDSVRKAHNFAMDEAKEMGHRFLGIEHLVIGLIREASSEGGSALTKEFLKGIDLAEARFKVMDTIGRGETIREEAGLTCTPRASQVMGLSVRCAVKLGAREIGIEHLLISLFQEARLGGKGSSLLPYSAKRFEEMEISAARYQLRV